jgi:hypothetical protein
MSDHSFKSFGDLYRAAFAESNAERKTILLSQVQKALEDWRERSVGRPSATAGAPTSPASCN